MLSRRMRDVAEMVEQGKSVCEVGCDHGYISIYPIQSGRSPHVTAMDVREGPLLRAGKHVAKYGVEDYITLRLSNGLSAYRTGEAKELICAGMGGRLMLRILEEFPEKTADFQALILQPQSEIPFFRRRMGQLGYRAVKEALVREEDKFYPIMGMVKADAAAEPEVLGGYSQEELLGPLLMAERPPELMQYIDREIRMREEIMEKLHEKDKAGTERSRLRRKELAGETALFRAARQMLYGGRERD